VQLRTPHLEEKELMFFNLLRAIPKGRNTFGPDIIMKWRAGKKALHNWFVVLRHVLMGHYFQIPS
jgi:hypothetical protein